MGKILKKKKWKSRGKGPTQKGPGARGTGTPTGKGRGGSARGGKNGCGGMLIQVFLYQKWKTPAGRGKGMGRKGMGSWGGMGGEK